MSYTLIQNLTSANYEKGNNGRKYIVIHYTGNQTDTASANANYFKSVNRDASAHYFVDKTQVVQVVSDTDTAWAVGVDYGGALFGKCTNYNSINIEMCSDGGKIADATFNNTVALTKTLMKKYSIPASNVVRHYDVCGKKCPGWTGWVGSDQSIWNKFKAALIGTSTTSTSTTSKSTTSTTSKSTKSSTSSGDAGVVFTYAVQPVGGKVLPEVSNLSDFAGIRGKKIANVAIKVNKGSVKYRVHVLGGEWLPWVTGYDWKDDNNGYAGNGKAIDAIQVYYNTPSSIASKYGYQKAQYRVSPLNGDYYSWQYDDETANGQDGYAGCFGKAIDRFQLY
jgi:N-acetylmuramoyl-L-alanine amidase CwlA